MQLIRREHCHDPNLPLVSVITPCYDYCETYLPETVESIAHQTYGNIEHLILHGNCGTDEPVITPVARNLLITEAQGEYILPLDADDKFVAPAVTRMMNHRNQADVISSLQAEFGDRNYAYGNPSYSLLNETGFYAANRIHCASLYRKDLWRELGGYDPNLRLAYEDWDFWLRAAKAGKTFYVIPQPLFLYRRHAGSMTTKVAANDSLAEFRSKWPLEQRLRSS